MALRFKKNAVPSKERFLYLIILTSLCTGMTSSFFIANVFPKSPNQWDVYIDIVMTLATIAGTILCYHTNKSGDDNEFIERYFCIGFPVGIQSFLFLIVIEVIFFPIASFMAQVEIPETSSFYDLIAMTVFVVYFYWRLNSSIKIASH